MVSTLPLMALKFKDFSLKNNIPKILLLVISVAALFILKWLAIPFVVLSYVLVYLCSSKIKQHDLHRSDKSNATKRIIGSSGKSRNEWIRKPRFTGVEDVRVGKNITLQINADSPEVLWQLQK